MDLRNRLALGYAGSVPTQTSFNSAEVVFAILQEAQGRYRVSWDALRSPIRNADVVMARQACMYAIRQCTDWQLKRIGEFFGGRDHTTVIHAIQSVENRAGKAFYNGRVQALLAAGRAAQGGGRDG